MTISTCIRNSLLCAAFGFMTVQAYAADEWHFVVANKTDSRIVNLQVSEDKSEWGDFDVGSGIGPGKTATMIWDHSTDGEGCEQWMRAEFADGSVSEASKQDFCADLDSPIEFRE